jgi:hypothetical protein
VNEVFAMVLILLLAGSGYAAGRVHGQFSYRLGFRYGYRQGYFDGDRASWNRRRRELQAAVASVMRTPAEVRSKVYRADGPVATTYDAAETDNDFDGANFDGANFDADGRHTVPEQVGGERRRAGATGWPGAAQQRTGEADRSALAEAGHAT